jgi:septum formation protein
MRLVLASASPRRKELLGHLGVPFDIAAADVDESVHAGEGARAYVARLAVAKAAALSSPGAVVVAADTSVVVDDHILGKPGDDAVLGARMLRSLSGRTHQVMTGVAVTFGQRREQCVVLTDVAFRALTDAEIGWYVATGEGRDKAGGYALQGRAGLFIERVVGSSTNVIGLPLTETVALLQAVGFPLPWSRP